MATKHVVGFSGGIDSQACVGWVLERHDPADVIVINSDAGGNEHPLTTEHVEWYSANVHPVVMVRAVVADLGGVGSRDGGTRDRRRSLGEDAPLTFDRLAFVKGRFPSLKAQFCTEYLKLAPQRREMAKLFDAGHDVIRYAGVRADESADRAKLPERQWDDYYDCELVRPLLRWTKRQCFDFAKGRGEQINPLYSLGFDRVGCAPCINSSKADIREWAARFPEMIDKVRRWEQSVGRPFFRPMLPGKDQYESDDPRKLNWIDEVVEWAKTTRGGKQTALPLVEADAANGTCVSKYGLCE